MAATGLPLHFRIALLPRPFLTAPVIPRQVALPQSLLSVSPDLLILSARPMPQKNSPLRANWRFDWKRACQIECFSHGKQSPDSFCQFSCRSHDYFFLHPMLRTLFYPCADLRSRSLFASHTTDDRTCQRPPRMRAALSGHFYFCRFTSSVPVTRCQSR